MRNLRRRWIGTASGALELLLALIYAPAFFGPRPTSFGFSISTHHQSQPQCRPDVRTASQHAFRHINASPISIDSNSKTPYQTPCRVGGSSLRRPTSLFGGYGIATNYSWREEQHEIDVTVSVPLDTKARDVSFKATSNSVDLRLKRSDGSDENSSREMVLLDGSRPTRGRVSVDGTYWSISDADDPSLSGRREITVTIEKNIVPPKDDFDVVEWDWGGLYPSDDNEVSERNYDEAEELDVREYAASLGVDIDNINMSMVDKDMFTSGLNVSKEALDGLIDAGYLQEVTRQADGSEYVTNDKGEAVPFAGLGDGIGADKLQDAFANGGGGRPPKKRTGTIPFVDTPAPWQQSVPAEEVRGVEDSSSTLDDGGAEVLAGKTEKELQRHQKPRVEVTNPSRGTEDKQNKEEEEVMGDASTPQSKKAADVDPIDLLTVVRLKEILREQGLKVSGTKQQLRHRLRAHVNSMLEEQ